MKHLRILLLALLPGFAFGQMKKEKFVVQYDAAGHTDTLVMHSPLGDTKSAPLPVFIWFSGQGQALYQNVNGVSKKVGVIDSDGMPKYVNNNQLSCKCYIMSLQNDWSSPAPQEVDYVFKNFVEQNYPVDITQVYDFGASAGGGAAIAHALVHPEYVSGVWSASTAAVQDSILKKFALFKADTIPLYMWWGTQDKDVFPVNVRNYTAQVQALGGQVETISENAGHFDLQNVLTGKTTYSNGETVYAKLFKHTKMPVVYTPPVVTVPPNKTISVDTTNVLQVIVVLKNGTLKPLL